MPTSSHRTASQHGSIPNYRRSRIAGGTYFFTVVTAHRRRMLTQTAAVTALRSAVTLVQNDLPFTIDAWVVLPDHMHAIWTLPDGDSDYSRRWGRIKVEFTRHCGLRPASGSRPDAGIWQPRFWEHLIRDGRDFAAHMDYLHYNPVKHALVERVADWPWSSFHRCVRRGIYTMNWGDCEPSAAVGNVGE